MSNYSSLRISRSRRLRSILTPALAAVTLALTGCAGSPTASSPAPSTTARTCGTLPLNLIGVRAIEAAPAWAGYYANAENCAGRSGPGYSRLRWFAVDRIEELDGSSSPIIGISCNDDIYLLSLSEGNVRHEILHHVIGGVGHPADQFPRCAEDLVGANGV